MPQPLLVVFAGLPGTGKTTLARRLSEERAVCYLRVDVVEAALALTGATVGSTGYAIVHELAVSNLLVGNDVVIDAVNSVPAARAGWREAAARGGAELAVFETVLGDVAEHRRRVEGRKADIPGHRPPTWAEVEDRTWAPWDVQRDGPRVVIDTTRSEAAWSRLREALSTRESTSE